jgi:hypothetical protein
MESRSAPKQPGKQPSKRVPMPTQRNPRNHMQLTHEQRPTKVTCPGSHFQPHHDGPRRFRPLSSV